MNLSDAVQLAQKTNKRIRREAWSNFLPVDTAVSMCKGTDVTSLDWLCEDQILSIALTDLKQKIKFLKPQDQTALLSALGITVSNKDHAQ